MRSKSQLCVCLVLAAIPAILWGFVNGPPVFRTGAAVDGGQDCTVCHATFRPANSDPRGRISVQVTPYTPGVKQIIRVRVEHPEAQRWGFQLTARLASDETRPAGTFTPSDEIRVRCGPAGGDAPCDGAVEFASHRAASTALGTPEGKTFEVEWTPPPGDAGDVILYAAGNAANGNSAPSGDRIYTTSVRLSPACALTARPSVSAVVNGASFQPGIGINAMISIFGSGFTTASRVAGSLDLVEGQFPKELGCLAVEVAGRRAPVVYVSPGQINAQVPTVALFGAVDVRVIANPGGPNELRGEARGGIAMQEYSPAFFTFFSNGRNIAAQHSNFDLLGDPNVIPGGRPAAPGDIVLLYGTGFGVTEPVWQAGEIPPQRAPLRDRFSVTIGGTTLRPEDILYAGLSPGSITGLYQFNVRIPPSTPDGDVPVVIEIGGLRTQSGATIRVRRP